MEDYVMCFSSKRLPKDVHGVVVLALQKRISFGPDSVNEILQS